MHVHQSACREARQERRGLDLNLKQLYYWRLLNRKE
jgi:hypothetical protein